MKGLRIKLNGRLFDIAIQQGCVGLTAALSHQGNEININGATDKCFRWHKGELIPGDRVTVEFTDIESPMQPEEVVFSKEEQIKDAKRFYDNLRRNFLKRGLSMNMNDRRSLFHIGPVRGSLEVLYNINLIDKFVELPQREGRAVFH